MLSLTAYSGDIITIGKSIVKIEKRKGGSGNSFKITIDADLSDDILRGELVERYIEQNGFEYVGYYNKTKRYKRLSDGELFGDFQVLKLLFGRLEQKVDQNAT